MRLYYTNLLESWSTICMLEFRQFRNNIEPSWMKYSPVGYRYCMKDEVDELFGLQKVPFPQQRAGLDSTACDTRVCSHSCRRCRGVSSSSLQNRQSLTLFKPIHIRYFWSPVICTLRLVQTAFYRSLRVTAWIASFRKNRVGNPIL